MDAYRDGLEDGLEFLDALFVELGVQPLDVLFGLHSLRDVLERAGDPRLGPALRVAEQRDAQIDPDRRLHLCDNRAIRIL